MLENSISLENMGYMKNFLKSIFGDAWNFTKSFLK